MLGFYPVAATPIAGTQASADATVNLAGVAASTSARPLVGTEQGTLPGVAASASARQLTAQGGNASAAVPGAGAATAAGTLALPGSFTLAPAQVAAAAGSVARSEAIAQPSALISATASSFRISLAPSDTLRQATTVASAQAFFAGLTRGFTGTSAMATAGTPAPFIVVVSPYRTLISQTVRIRALGRNIPNPSRSL